MNCSAKKLIELFTVLLELKSKIPDKCGVKLTDEISVRCKDNSIKVVYETSNAMESDIFVIDNSLIQTTIFESCTITKNTFLYSRQNDSFVDYTLPEPTNLLLHQVHYNDIEEYEFQYSTMSEHANLITFAGYLHGLPEEHIVYSSHINKPEFLHTLLEKLHNVNSTYYNSDM